ncbi:MAG: D-alanyl-D-alanine carboxypeptidase family protein [Fluviicoccus sp.]|uniref:D-alanyl-D-alanine carboxypeptidase family protein n=1 Tax=Fluviicoccus sp. TaxID=2003552 RepID=UPI00271E78E2|nr:D-alanyl-D-alanine carboxypeptidase family protein [Fluviicoccus sp.]MDO8331238.1 D-alanyl-D-alanine carboxypeptidase family protein [Fluviicoccus sp.]
MLAAFGFAAFTATVVNAATIVPSAPVLENKAYLLMDYDSGQVLASSNPDQRVAPASLTKMMTSFLVEQRLIKGTLKETDPVLMSESAWCRGTSAESCMYVPVNTSASVIDMLRGVIIQSGNDASKALAEHLAGNEPAFAEMMNAEAKHLGMNGTHFANATGLSDPNHYTTARDMGLLAHAIIKDSSKYYPIYSEKEFTFNNIKQGNRNALLYTDPTVDGLKTGHTDEAGYCLVASSKRGPMRLISVVMGTNAMQARADQTRALFNWGFANYETAQVRPKGQELGKPAVWFGKGDAVSIGLASDMNVTLPRGQKDQLKLTLQVPASLDAPLKLGQEIGKIVVTLDGKTVAEQALVTLQPVEEANFVVRIWHHIKKFFAGLF